MLNDRVAVISLVHAGKYRATHRRGVRARIECQRLHKENTKGSKVTARVRATWKPPPLEIARRFFFWCGACWLWRLNYRDVSQ